MTAPQDFLDGRVTLYPGDCLEVLALLPENSVDSVVCDPPYHLTSIVKRFAKTGGADRKPSKKHHQYGRLSRGFMGKEWDGGDIAFQSETWSAVLRVMKPGSYLIAFSGTRTYHRMVCAIEDAGFDVRDQLAWVFGSGFPKSKNLGDGFGTALKPSWEPICLARKPLIGTNAENLAAYGVAGLNIDGCRVGTDDHTNRTRNVAFGLMHEGRERQGGTPTISGSKLGRWPANLIHDGSEEVLAAFPDLGKSTGGRIGNAGGGDVQNVPTGAFSAGDPGFGDSGSAARFFYSAKADAEDRIGSKHPTVKPLDLMQYLCRLVTPPGGTVLDPFAGTGTSGEAAWREGFNAILIEREAEYQADIARRMDLAIKPTKRAAVAKSKGKLLGAEGTPLFGESAA